MKPMITLALVGAVATLGACQNQPAATAAALSEADAAAAVDAVQAAWVTMDAAKIEAVYAKDVVAFDVMDPPLSTTWDNWHKLQQGFAAMKFDKIDVPDRKIQILDSDTFVASGTGTLSGSGELKEAKMRFTDVYQKQADGTWLIVNEHVSFVPEAPPA
ncbi:MAG: YybH family protein [Novosphingobium sp.]